MSSLSVEITEDVTTLPGAGLWDFFDATEPSKTNGASFAVLDAAVLTNLVDLADTRGGANLCLFKGELAEEMRDLAPYLYAVDSEVEFTENLLTQSKAPWHLWGRGGGIYLSSKKPINEVQAHLRRFTRMKGDAGKSYYFRFWEPEMLHAFLTACTEEELSSFFGAGLITRVVLPGKDGASLTTLSYTGDPHEVRSFPLHARHLDAFAMVSWARFLTEMVLYVRAEHGDVVGHDPDDAMTVRLDTLLRRAHESYGLTQKGSQKVFVDVAMMFGDGFDTDPSLPWARDTLVSPNFTNQMARSRALARRANAHAPAEVV